MFHHLNDYFTPVYTFLYTFDFVIINYIIECPPLPNHENGDIVTTHGNWIGSLATFTCHANFVLVGDAALLCYESQTWNGTSPVCKQKGYYVFSI